MSGRCGHVIEVASLNEAAFICLPDHHTSLIGFHAYLGWKIGLGIDGSKHWWLGAYIAQRFCDSKHPRLRQSMAQNILAKSILGIKHL